MIAKKKKKNPTPPPPHLFSLAQRRWKDSLVGLLHILPRLGKSGGHIPHSSPFSYSLRLSLFCPLLFFFFIYVFCWRWGGGTHGTIAGELLEKRTEWAAGMRKRFLELRRASVVIRALWNTRRSISFRALPGDMDLGNYLLAWKRVCLFCAVISVQVLTVKEREKDWLWEKK